MSASVLHQPDPPDLKKLLDEVAVGDMQAFATLVNSYKDAVTEAAERVLGKGELAAGSAKATFLHVNRLLAAGAKPDAFLPWLIWVTKNDALALAGRYNDKHNDESRVYHIDDLRIEPDPDDEPERDNKITTEGGIAEPEEQELNRSAEKKASQKKQRRATDIPEGSFYVPFYDDDEPEPLRRRKRTGMTVSLIIICLLIIIFLWVLLGILRANGALSFPDLGYNWFNTTLYRLF